MGKWWFNGGFMGFNQQNGDFNGMYPLVNITIAMYIFNIAMVIEIDGLPSYKMGGSFHGYVK